MNLQQLMDWHLFVFYLFGHNSLISRYRCHVPDRGFNCIKFAPSIILTLIICIICGFLLIYQIFFALFYNHTDIIVAVLLILSEFIAIVVVIHQSLFHYDVHLQLLEIFESIDSYLTTIFQVKLDFRRFVRKYITKVFLITVVYSWMFIIKIILRSNISDFVLEILLNMMRLFSLVAKMHAIFYVSLLNAFIKFTINVVLVHQRNMVGAMNLIQNLRRFKCVHLKLYEATLLINDFFGWSFVMQCLQSFFNSTYAAYWIWCYTQVDYVYIISKNSYNDRHYSIKYTLFCLPYDGRQASML